MSATKRIFHRLIDPPYDYALRGILTVFARAVIKMLNDAEVAYWADCGTLLGIIRDGGIILGDTDVDISVIEAPDTIEKLDKCCERRHFWFVIKKDENRRSYCCDFRLIPVHCDIYVLRPQADSDILIGCEGPFSDLSRELVTPLVTRMWGDLSVRIPAEPERLLAFRYGDDWHVKRLGYLGRLHSTYHPTNEEDAKLRRMNSTW